jgi:hypothetical protein
MQILKIWNNLFTKDLEIHSNFLSYIFLIFVNVQKKSKSDAIPSKFKIYLCKYLKFGMIFSPKFFEFSLIFLVFSVFCEFSKSSKF